MALFTLSGPRGVGKSVTIEALNALQVARTILPYTDRGLRQDDMSTARYNFVSTDEYSQMIGDRALCACIKLPNGERYGTAIHDLEIATETDDAFIVTSATQTALDIKLRFGAKALMMLPDSFANIPIMMRASGISGAEIRQRQQNDPNDTNRETLENMDGIFINRFGNHRAVVDQIAEYITTQ